MQGGGAERVAALLCNAWAEEGHEVILMPTFSGRGKCVYPLDPRVRLEFLADCVGSAQKTVWTKFKRLWTMHKVIQNIAADVVVSFFTNINVTAIVAATGTGVPVIVSERIYPPLYSISRFWSIMRRLTYPRATYVVAQTERGKDWIEAHCPGSQVKVIPNPLALPLPEGEPIMDPQVWVPPDRKLLLAVGRLHQQKGFDLLLEAFAALGNKFPDWDLMILGEGSEREALETKRMALCLEGRVFMPGRVGNISQWYKRADLFVMSSRYEGFPNVLLEAMAHGLATVSFDCKTGPQDLIRHEVNGVLVPLEKDVKGLTVALKSLMVNEAVRSRMGAAACEVRDRFSKKTVKVLWAEVLNMEL